MNKKKSSTTPTQCEMCAYYDYDEEYDQYLCIMNMDEDETARFYSSHEACPYFRFYDEYKIVQKQN